MLFFDIECSLEHTHAKPDLDWKGPDLPRCRPLGSKIFGRDPRKADGRYAEWTQLSLDSIY